MTTNSVFDAATDFSSSNPNPNGVWQYGWEATQNSSFNALSSFNQSNFSSVLNMFGFLGDNWTTDNYTFITIEKNNDSKSFVGVQPQQLGMHPGSSNEYTVLRFIVPTNNAYSIFAQAFSGDFGDTDATVLLNGQSIGYVDSTNSSPVILNSIVKILTKGDTLDLLIGSKSDNTGDTTPIKFVITPQNTTVVTSQILPTGSVTISGTAQQNQTLTASNNLADANGLGVINYSWLSNGAVISNQPSYVLTQNDVGKSISVTASYTDGLNKVESVTSSTVTVANVNDLPTGSVSILGDAKVGQTLTAQNTLQDLDGLGVISYQWLNNGAVLSSQSSYTLTASDAGKTISVKASYTDLQNTPENVTSSSVTVAAATNYAPTGSVTISGTAQQNQTLTASNNLADANGLGMIGYQWLSNSTVVSTQPTYSLTQSDVGKSIQVEASYTDGLGKSESVSSSSMTVANVNDLPTGNVTISGTPTQGQILTSSNNLADIDGLGTISYQWLNDSGAISGATASSYTLTTSDVSKTISVKASYIDSFGTSENVTSSSVTISAAAQTAPTGFVSIDGVAAQNQIITANTSAVADINGLGVFSYQWLSNGNLINSQTAQSYSLTQADVSKNISVKVSYTDGLQKPESISSSSVIVSNMNDLPTGSVSISGTATQGQILTASNNLADIDGLGAISYQWLNDGNVISGATASTYTLAASDVGKAISVKASYTDLQNTAENVISNSTALIATPINYPPTGDVTILGNTKVGEVLTAKNTLNDANGLGAISYQWLKNSLPISGANQATYTLTKGDAGKAISVKASYTDLQNNTESKSSEATDLVELNEPTYLLSATKTNIDEGTTVTFNLETTNLEKNTVVPFNFDGDISDNDVIGGLPTSEFLLNEKGKASLSIAFAKDKTTEGVENLTLTLNDDTEQSISVSVNDTSITKIVNHLPTGEVKIQGTAKVGAVLSIANTLKDTDGLGDFNYQWLSAGKAILGATTETYTLTKTDTDKKISVKVSYTDGLNTLESKTSAETTAVKLDPNAGLTKVGTSSNNKIVGAEKNDNLSGLAGADTLLGYAGDDLLDGGNGNDSIDAGNGNDMLLGGDGNDILLAGSGNDSLDGGKGDDKLTGDKGNDTLQGGVGADNMAGGVGDDYYFVDNKKDVITEVKAAGTDTIESTLTYTLGTNVENLNLAGIFDNSGTGNELNNKITGNVGDNKLNGGAGNDTLVGGAGADELNGGLGKDALIGGNDDDIYYMNNTEDTITETATGGEKDEIMASVSFELSSSNVEILTLSGVKAINGTGDEFNNLIQEIDGGLVANNLNGKAGDDTINGEGGDDSIEGGEGNDVIDGGDGSDKVIFNGALEDYQIAANQDVSGSFTVLYTGDNPDINEGEDSLTNVEILEFNGDSYTIDELVLNGVIA